MRKIVSTQVVTLPLLAIWLMSSAGCALYPSWHWTRPGADSDALAADENQCKTSVYTDASGIVTQASVRRMHNCMAGKGWSRQEH
jgi:hypothetical protein